MNDLIRREAAMKFTTPEDWGTPDERWRPESEYGKFIEALPPAQRWIPVTERLPEKEGYYLLTVESLIAEAGSVVISRPYNGRGGFCDVYWNNVIAWMELPEPYKDD